MLNRICGAILMFEDTIGSPDTKIDENSKWAWINEIVDAIYSVLWPLLVVVAAAGTIYAIVLGVNMAKADSTEKREEAKRRLINVVVGVAIIVGLILLMTLLINTILPALLGVGEGANTGT